MKNYYGGPIGIRTHQPSFESTVPSPTLYGLPFPKIGGSQPLPKTAIAIISGKGKATNFKFGKYIHRVHPNKSTLQIWEKREPGRIQGLANFFEYPLLSQEWVKLGTLNFVRAVIESIGTKAHYKNVGKSSRGRTQGLSKFFRAHIARSSLR